MINRFQFTTGAPSRSGDSECLGPGGWEAEPNGGRIATGVGDGDPQLVL